MPFDVDFDEDEPPDDEPPDDESDEPEDAAAPDVSPVFSDVFSAALSPLFSEPFSADVSAADDSDEPDPDRLSLRYQPLPLNTMPTEEKTFRSRPRHSGHWVNDGSLNAWTCSKRWSQAVQA